MIVAVTGAVVVLVAVNDAISPVPLAARPIDVVLFVQLYTVPGADPVNVTAVVGAPLQTDWLLTGSTFGVGFTVMVKLISGPVQLTPLLVNTGVTVMVATTGAVPLLIAVNDAMLPLPDAARPIVGTLFVQLKVVPVTGLVKFTAVVGELLQTTWLATGLAVGVGFTVMVKVLAGPVQVTPPLV